MINFVARGLCLLVLPIALSFAFYIHCFGESSPGGGFQAGLLIASCLILVHLSFNKHLLNNKTCICIICYAILTYICFGIACLAIEGDFLNLNLFASGKMNYLFSHYFNLNPKIASQKLSIFIVETCILAVVTCCCYQLYRAVLTKN